MIFWLVLKLEISYRVIIISWRIFEFFIRGFFEDFNFARWNIWVSIILLLPEENTFFYVNGEATVWHSPRFFLYVINEFVSLWFVGLVHHNIPFWRTINSPGETPLGSWEGPSWQSGMTPREGQAWKGKDGQSWEHLT
jgi:hypothetical protein